MESKFDKLKMELKDLIRQGDLLYYSMANAQGQLSPESVKMFQEKDIEFPNFITEYDIWYSEALLVIKQIIPDRLADFVKQYKDEKRKEIDFLTYGISDYLLGLKTSRGGQAVSNQSAAIPKMQNQITILKSAQKRFESQLFDIKEVIQADIYDSELGAAKDLAKKGFARGAGAIAGVVLEKHLGHVCELHGLSTRKKHPSISDFYQLLKENEIIDTPKWRFIQHLGDIRNLCDHNKEREPTKEEVLELVEGVDKVIKTVF
ncbi:hypothetical protein [Acinetobacter tandoii]|uniref:DUF4145 domain-containing protein n=1 Tax=Acinetobacter tandoii DSM 14970 = CIP 107469 TaxID=1120927 RepID=R9AYA5_9GAMM|nr:hypothetical protein [Acinetobacter tandoii]EOR07173.1 hypothetical protein I593_02060 [Acinetobacter tandoii DSM 14970 = CIP 107469]